MKTLFGNLARRMGRDLVNRELVSDFKHVNQTFAVLSQNLQKSIMAVRKTPVKPLLQRQVREMSEE